MAEKYVVLFIDDEETVLDTIKMQLQGVGSSIQIETALSGKEAFDLVAWLELDGSVLAMIVCDYLMPGKKGDRVLKGFQKSHPTAVKILLTGQSVFKGVTNCINHAQLYRFIAKPWNTSDLKLTIKEGLKKFKADRIIDRQQKEIKKINQKLEETRKALDEGQGTQDDQMTVELQFTEREAYDELFFIRFFKTLRVDEKEWMALACIGLIVIDEKMTRRQKGFLEAIVKDDPRKDLVIKYISLAESRISPELKIFRCDRDLAFEFMKHLTRVLSMRQLPSMPQQQYFTRIGQLLGLDSRVINDFLKLSRRRIEDVIAENQVKKVVSVQPPTYIKFNLKM